MCVAELTNHVACKLKVTRKNIPTSHMTSRRESATPGPIERAAAGRPELLGSAQRHIHASRLKDLVYQFDITSGTASRQCDNTHICLIDNRLLKTICGATHRLLGLLGLTSN